MEIWPYFLAELLRYGGGVPAAIGTNMAAAGIVAGLRAVFKRDPFESLQRKALKALEPTIPGGEQRNALWRSLGEVFRDRELVSREEWCAVLARNRLTEAFAAELYDEMEREFSALVVRAARRDPTVFIQSAHKKLEELQAGQQDILAFVSQIGTVIEQGGTTAAQLGAIVKELEELKETVLATSAPSSVRSLHQLPAPPGDFTGRAQELRELSDALHQGGVTISGVAGVAGMGGVGKTVLALKLAQQLADDYPDAQFYLDLKGTSPQPLTTADAMAHVIRGFYPKARMPDSEAELSGLYHTCLHGRRALLLMDNAAGARQVEPLIPPEGCLLLVTSRQHFTPPGLYAKSLQVLPPGEARELLLKISPRIGDHADEIAKLCGYLPLALRLAAGALAEHPDLSPQEYARKLTDARARLELVDASLGLSYDLLSEERRKLWRALAVFPGEFDAPAAATVWESEPDVAQDALSALVAASMVEWNESSRRYRLHDLARDCADSRLSDQERAAAQRRHAEHYKAVLAAADDLYLQGGEGVVRGLTLFDLEWPNIQLGQAWAGGHAEEEDAAARLCSHYPDAGVYVLSLRQHPREWISWREAALAAARKLKDRQAEGVHLGNLGSAYFALGEPRRAIECHEQALAIAREIGDRRGEGTALGNLGNAYAELGEPRRAIKLHEQALAILREIGDWRLEGTALANLGIAYFELGEPRRAIEFYEQQLKITREIGDRRGEGNALWNMALALDEVGARGPAIANAEAALEIFEQIEAPAAAKVRAKLAQWRRDTAEPTSPRLRGPGGGCAT